MNDLLILGMAVSWLALLAGGWLGWQLLRQNGRMLLRLDELEKRLDELGFRDQESMSELHGEAIANGLVRGDNAEDRATRFKSGSLARSRIKRDGLKTGTPAPGFCLPRLDGRGQLSLEELRGRRALLVFSSPHCGPCNSLAPELEKFHRDQADVEVVMISMGEPKENRAKTKEHGLTFPVVLQQHYEISRRYAMFATPIAYLIDEAGIIAQDVSVGTDAIRELMARHRATVPN